MSENVFVFPTRNQNNKIPGGADEFVILIHTIFKSFLWNQILLCYCFVIPGFHLIVLDWPKSLDSRYS